MNSELNLVADECGERLFAEATSQFTGADGRELFSFGNGTFYDGMEAKEILSSDSKHVACVLTKDSYVILEKKKMFAHLCDLPCLEQGYPLHEVVKMLEDAGEANVNVSHHIRQGMEISQDKALVFCLEGNNERPRKKQKTNKNKKSVLRLEMVQSLMPDI